MRDRVEERGVSSWVREVSAHDFDVGWEMGFGGVSAGDADGRWRGEGEELVKKGGPYVACCTDDEDLLKSHFPLRSLSVGCSMI